MTRVSRKALPEEKIGLYVDEFWRAVTLLESKDEVRAFFRDMITSTERVMLAKRLQIAKWLYQGADYTFIKKELNVSNTAIAGVSRWLDSFGEGYKLIIPRLLALSKRKQLPGVWRYNSQAKLLAGAIALGATGIRKEIIKRRKRHSVSE